MTPQELRRYRRQMGLSQPVFARSVGVSYGALRKYESGDRPIPEDLPLRVSLRLRDLALTVKVLSERLRSFSWSRVQVEELAQRLVDNTEDDPAGR